MLLVYVGSMALMFIFAVPLTTGLLARRMGRSFAAWFALSCVLPLIATIILCFLPEPTPR